MKKILALMLVGMFLISFALAEVYVCCERTNDGAWCQNAPEEQCDESGQVAPTSCDSTSYCRLGCCYNSVEGTCLENTPEKVCTSKDGVWNSEPNCDIPQCGLGCCIMGDQAAFVTQTRCKKLSSLYGLETNFRTDIGNELTCIASVTSSVEGACVYEEEFQKTCQFLTKKECQDTLPNADFYAGRLCSDPQLNTTCGPSRETTCVPGRDEVYFLDTCGNVANIYDYDRKDDMTYWSETFSKEESCGYGANNADSKKCGSCDYYYGSTCQDYKNARKNNNVLGSPLLGDNICADLGCMYNGVRYEHGETWCASNAIDEDLRDAPGSRDFRLVCYNGEVTVEPCADYRGEVCIETDVRDGFTSAICKVNRWQDCFIQDDEDECENRNVRDCQWENNECVPLNSPGLDFWASDEAVQVCSQGSATCVVKYEKKLGGDWDCASNCQCLTPGWSEGKNSVCSLIGDCGNSENFLGILGQDAGFDINVTSQKD